MKIIIEMQGETIRKAASLVMEHYKDPGFLVNLGAIHNFNHTNDTGYELGRKIYNSDMTMTIKPYSTFSPWSKAIGYASGNTIFVNVRKLDLSLKDRIENLFHESMHLLGYSHKGNRVNEYNLKTVPYLGANLFVKYLESIGKI